MAKFLTLNTHSWMEEEQETKLNQLVECILQEKYDVICLQEVNQLTESEQVRLIINNTVSLFSFIF